MKISSLYLNDITDYESLTQKMCKDISDVFYNVGKNSLSLSKFISYIRHELMEYINLKHNKQINIVVFIPITEKHLIEKKVENAKEKIIIRLDKNIIYDILDGREENYEDYISQIIEVLDTEIKHNKRNIFDNYLVVKMNQLVDICKMELDPIDKSTIIKSSNWAKLTHKSTIFKDYYNFYLQDKKTNRVTFIKFIEKLIQS